MNDGSWSWPLLIMLHNLLDSDDAQLGYGGILIDHMG